MFFISRANKQQYSTSVASHISSSTNYETLIMQLLNRITALFAQQNYSYTFTITIEIRKLNKDVEKLNKKLQIKRSLFLIK